MAVFYLSLVAILVGTNARRAEEDKEEDEDAGQKCQVRGGPGGEQGHRTKMPGMRRTRRRTRTQDKNARYEEDKEEDKDTGQKCQV